MQVPSISWTASASYSPIHRPHSCSISAQSVVRWTQKTGQVAKRGSCS